MVRLFKLSFLVMGLSLWLVACDQEGETGCGPEESVDGDGNCIPNDEEVSAESAKNGSIRNPEKSVRKPLFKEVVEAEEEAVAAVEEVTETSEATTTGTTTTTTSTTTTTTATTTTTTATTTTTTTTAGDTTAPPDISAITGRTSLTAGSIELTLTMPSDTSDYSSIALRRSQGTSAPGSCSDGSLGTTITDFTDDDSSTTGTQVIVNDATGATNTAFSYRVCISDSAGNTTSSTTLTNVTSTLRAHKAFVTSVSFDLDLQADHSSWNGSAFNGGLEGADFRCQYLADQQSLGSKWMAVMSDRTASAKDRLNIVGPVYNMSNQRVAETESDFFSGTWTNPILYDETGATATGFIATGTQADGDVEQGYTCDAWREGFASGADQISLRVGLVTATTGNQSLAWGNSGCGTDFPIYCIEQQQVPNLLGAFSASSSSGTTITLSLAFPADTTDYSSVTIRRRKGAAPPHVGCASSFDTLVDTITDFSQTWNTTSDSGASDSVGTAGRYSYRACVYNSSGEVIHSKTIETVKTATDFNEVFVSIDRFDGNLTTTYRSNTFSGGTDAQNALNGADKRCETIADRAGFGTTGWKALISTTGTDASSRITLNSALYNMGYSGADKVADNTTDLWDGTLDKGIYYTTTGNILVYLYNWSGSTSAGAKTTNCTDFTSDTFGETGAGGYASLTSGWFTGSLDCSTPRNLICFRNGDP